MRILPSPRQPSPIEPPEAERQDGLEKIAQTILQRLQTLEKRIDALEKMPKAEIAIPVSAAAAAPEPKSAPATAPHLPGLDCAPTEEKTTPAPAPPSTAAASKLDTEAIKKGLLAKMWKYLNDAPPSQPA